MPGFNGNNGYLVIEGTDLSGFITEVTGLEAEVGVEDVTAGFGADGVSQRPKLEKRKGKIIIAYFEGRIPTYIPKLKVGGPYNMVYGPEGAVSGKPKHQQDILVSKLGGMKQTVDKSLIVFEADWEQADQPTADMHAGAVFA